MYEPGILAPRPLALRFVYYISNLVFFMLICTVSSLPLLASIRVSKLGFRVYNPGFLHCFDKLFEFLSITYYFIVPNTAAFNAVIIICSWPHR